MSPSLAFLLICFQLVRVAAYKLTMSPDHIRSPLFPETVSFTCTADTPLTGCQFRWWRHTDGAGPLVDMGQGSRSRGNADHLNRDLSGYRYSGRGLGAGDCGLSLKISGVKWWLVACRVRAETGGWTYAWSDLFTSVGESLPYTTETPREYVVLPAGEARFTLKAQEPLSVCELYSTGLSFQINEGAKSDDTTGRHRYIGAGLGDGECSVALANVSETDNGPCVGRIMNTAGNKSDIRYTALIIARRPTAPSLTVVKENKTIDATCVVKDFRPRPQITWLLGDDVIRQDLLDDTPGSLEDEWWWPWMRGSLMQRVALRPKLEDNGKLLKCRVSHVTLDQHLEVNERILIKTSCPPLASNTTTITCFSGRQVVNCTRPLPIGSWAEAVCKPGYTASKDLTDRTINCTDSGDWDRPVFACLPDCGRRNTNAGQLQIYGGEKTARVGEFPWHVAIYEKEHDSYKQICGGSLISTRIVISAAHCFWNDQFARKDDSSAYGVAAGKHKRAWLDAEDDDLVQRRQVELITIHPQYHGRPSSFQSDIALVQLTAPVDITAHVNLVCVDWGNLWEESQLQHGNDGTVPGWGYTQQHRPSSVLKHVELPYIAHDTCFNALDESLKPLFTFDKFCAGYANRSVSTCKGDSGGGLVFLHVPSNQYYLRGLLSISFKPASSIDLCYSELYTAFTLVSNYHRWMTNHGV